MRKISEWVNCKLQKGQFIRNVSILAGGTVIAQVINFTISPILTRLYSPDEFGVLTVYISIISFLCVIASWRFELAIPLPEDDESAVNLLVLSISIVIGMSGLTMLVLWIARPVISQWVSISSLTSYWWILPISLLGIGVYQVINYWAIRRQAFDVIARTKISQSIGQNTVQLGMGLFKCGTVGLLLGDVIGRINGSGRMLFLVWKRDRNLFRHISVTGMLNVAYRYRRFPLISSWSAVLNTVGLQLPPLLLAACYGSDVTGWFSLGWRTIGISSALVGQSIAQVYVGEMTALVRDNPEKLHQFFIKTTVRLLFYGLIPFLVLLFEGGWLFRFFFGEDWQMAGYYAQLLSPTFLLAFVIFPVSQTLNILEYQGLQLVWDLGRSLLVGGVFVVAVMEKWDPANTIRGLSGILSVGYIGLFLMIHFAIQRYTKSLLWIKKN